MSGDCSWLLLGFVVYACWVVWLGGRDFILVVHSLVWVWDFGFRFVAVIDYIV